MADATKEKRIAEYHYFSLDFDSYVHKLGIPIADAQRTLWVTSSQFNLWRETQRLPVPVWNRAVALWGDQGIRPKGAAQRVHFKPFMLPARYGTSIPVSVPDAVLTPVPTLAPASNVPYLDVIDTLVRFAATIAAEKALLVKENFRLQRTITLLQQDHETASDLAALEATTPLPAAPDTVVAPVREALRQTITDASLLRQIEERLPFVIAR